MDARWPHRPQNSQETPPFKDLLALDDFSVRNSDQVQPFDKYLTVDERLPAFNGDPTYGLQYYGVDSRQTFHRRSFAPQMRRRITNRRLFVLTENRVENPFEFIIVGFKVGYLLPDAVFYALRYFAAIEPNWD